MSDAEVRPTATKVVEIDSHAINFGPQHPAAHGEVCPGMSQIGRAAWRERV